MNQLTSLLQSSMEIYQEVLDKTIDIANTISELQAPEINQYAEELKASMQKAKELDSKISEYTLPDGNNQIEELFNKRQGVIKQILDLNASLEPRLQGIKVMQQNELKKIKHGRQTTSGYGGHVQHLSKRTGRIINASE